MNRPDSPACYEKKFNCPHCNTLAHQNWYNDIQGRLIPDHDRERLEGGGLEPRYLIGTDPYGLKLMEKLNMAICHSCEKHTIWYDKKLIYPLINCYGFPSDGLPTELKMLYYCAGDIADRCPSGAVALLRLILEKFMNGILGDAKGDTLEKSLNIGIGKGLISKTAKPSHLIRLFGNDALHEGNVDLSNDRDAISHLFKSLNSLVDDVIDNKTTDDMYKRVPKKPKTKQ